MLERVHESEREFESIFQKPLEQLKFGIMKIESKSPTEQQPCDYTICVNRE